MASLNDIQSLIEIALYGGGERIRFRESIGNRICAHKSTSTSGSEGIELQEI